MAYVGAGYPLDVEGLLIVELDGPPVEVDYLVERVADVRALGGVAVLPQRRPLAGRAGDRRPLVVVDGRVVVGFDGQRRRRRALAELAGEPRLLGQVVEGGRRQGWGSTR